MLSQNCAAVTILFDKRMLYILPYHLSGESESPDARKEIEVTHISSLRCIRALLLSAPGYPSGRKSLGRIR